MSIALALRDQTTSGVTSNEVVVEFPRERMTVRQLIRRRVYKEVEDYNEKRPEYFKGLVAPSDAERTLNGFKLKKQQRIDWRVQYKAALEGFEKQRFFVLVDNRQVESLREEILIRSDTEVSFLKLVPLVGG